MAVVLLNTANNALAIVTVGMCQLTAIVTVAVLSVGMKSVLVAFRAVDVLIRYGTRATVPTVGMFILVAGGIDNVSV